MQYKNVSEFFCGYLIISLLLICGEVVFIFLTFFCQCSLLILMGLMGINYVDNIKLL